MWEFLLQVVIGCFAVGVIAFAIDTNWGIRLYRVWFNNTHDPKERIAVTDNRGFIFNRSANVHKRTALILSLLYLGYKIIYFEEILPTVFGPLIAFFVFMVSFRVAPSIIGLVTRLEKLDPDKVESSATTWFGGIRNRFTKTFASKPVQTEASTEASVSAKPVDDVKVDEAQPQSPSVASPVKPMVRTREEEAADAFKRLTGRNV